MIRIVIAEDNLLCREQIYSYISRFGQEQEEEFAIESYSDGFELLEHYNAEWDILFLDIEMPKMDGMSAAREIRRMDSSVFIVFITNLAKYAIKGYEVDALDFILKPISYFPFSVKLKKMMRKVKAEKRTSLVITGKDGITKLYSEEIYYVEVRDHWLYIHTSNGVFQKLGTLREMEETLHSSCFSKCNKCYLVNLRYLRHIHGNTAVLESGDELQISRPRLKEFQLEVMNYYGGNGND